MNQLLLVFIKKEFVKLHQFTRHNFAQTVIFLGRVRLNEVRFV